MWSFVRHNMARSRIWPCLHKRDNNTQTNNDIPVIKAINIRQLLISEQCLCAGPHTWSELDIELSLPFYLTSTNERIMLPSIHPSIGWNRAVNVRAKCEWASWVWHLSDRQAQRYRITPMNYTPADWNGLNDWLANCVGIQVYCLYSCFTICNIVVLVMVVVVVMRQMPDPNINFSHCKHIADFLIKLGN